MELVKQKMQITWNKGKTVTQLTLDDDFNVPDSKEDIDRIMKYEGTITSENIRVSEGKAGVKGKLNFRLLYGGAGEENSVHSMKGSIPFEEIINMEGLLPEDEVRLSWDMEDLNISMINSRKISVKAVVTLWLEAENTSEEEAAVEISGDDDAEYMTSRLTFTPARIKTKDTYRVKDEIEVSGNKPNISEIIWDNAQLRSVETRPMEGKIQIRGEIFLFILYTGEDENSSIQWSEHTIPVNGTVDCAGCREDMIPHIHCSLSGNDVEAKPDTDGEQRMLGIDYVIDMDICLYEDQDIDIINDVYSAVKDLEPSTKMIHYQRLVMKNSSKCKTADKIKLSPDQPKILQICNSGGSIRLDDAKAVEDGIQIEGAVAMSLLYAALDDKHPLQTLEGILPFTHKIEVSGMKPGCIFRLEHSLEQLGAVMTNSEEIEVKAVINLDCLVMEELSGEVMTNVTAKPYDLNKIQELPGIVGYIVKPGDTLWKIAKKFYTTVDSIKSINELSDDRIKPGDKLVLMKKVEEL